MRISESETCWGISSTSLLIIQNDRYIIFYIIISGLNNQAFIGAHGVAITRWSLRRRNPANVSGLPGYSPHFAGSFCYKWVKVLPIYFFNLLCANYSKGHTFRLCGINLMGGEIFLVIKNLLFIISFWFFLAFFPAFSV